MNVETKLFDLNIEKVLEHWGLEHALREIIANALDEQAITSTREIEIFQDKDSRWHIRDYGRGIEYRHFVQNENAEKLASPNLIGKFGVGLKDALAVLWRNGITIEIHSKFAKITLTMAQKSGFALETLHAVFQESDRSMDGTEFIITGIPSEVIAKAKSMFLMFGNARCLEKTKYGDVYSRNGSAGIVYVNGVQVAIEENFLFSYNITNINAAIRKALNRERTNVGRTAYANSVKQILVQCKTREVLFSLVNDLKSISLGTNRDESSWVDVSSYAAATLNKNENVVFVSPHQRANLTNKQVEILQQSGKSVVLVPDTIMERLGNNITTFSNVYQEYQESLKYEFIDPGQLTLAERNVYEKKDVVIQFLKKHGYKADVPIKISHTLRIGLDGQEKCDGVWVSGIRTVVVKRSVLNDLTRYLAVLAHEFAHYISGATDNTRAFESVLTSMLGFALTDIDFLKRKGTSTQPTDNAVKSMQPSQQIPKTLDMPPVDIPSALFNAIKNGRLDVVRILLRNNPNWVISNGQDRKTPLHHAVELDNVAIVQHLIECGADVNAKDNEGNTPLHLAAQDGNIGIVKLLGNADINANNYNDQTPLHQAARCGNIDVVMYLVSKKWADIDAKDDDGRSPLHLAAQEGKIEIVKYLVSKGADIDAEND